MEAEIPLEGTEEKLNVSMFPQLVPSGADAGLSGELSYLRTEVALMRSVLGEVKAIQSPLVGIEQVAVYFGKSQDTIRRWVNDRIISCYKIPNAKGHTLLFSFKQLESDLEDYAQYRL